MEVKSKPDAKAASMFWTALYKSSTNCTVTRYFPMLFDLLKDPTNCSATVHCKWTSLSTAGVCASVFVRRAASGQKSWGMTKDRYTNLSRPLQYISPLSLPLSLILFHPIDPILWQTDFHLMQQQLCAVAFCFHVFALFIHVCGHCRWPRVNCTFIPY